MKRESGAPLIPGRRKDPSSRVRQFDEKQVPLIERTAGGAEAAPKAEKPVNLTKSLKQSTKETMSDLMVGTLYALPALPLIVANAALGSQTQGMAVALGFPEKAQIPFSVFNTITQGAEMAALDSTVMKPFFIDVWREGFKVWNLPRNFVRELYYKGHSVNSIAGVLTLTTLRAVTDGLAFFYATYSFLNSFNSDESPYLTLTSQIVGALAGILKFIAAAKFELPLWTISYLELIRFLNKKTRGEGKGCCQINPERYTHPLLPSKELAQSIVDVLEFIEKLADEPVNQEAKDFPHIASARKQPNFSAVKAKLMSIVSDCRAEWNSWETKHSLQRDPFRKLTDVVSHPEFKRLLWGTHTEAKVFQAILTTFAKKYDAAKTVRLLKQEGITTDANLQPAEEAEGASAPLTNLEEAVAVMQNLLLQPQVWTTLFGVQIPTNPEDVEKILTAVRQDLQLPTDAQPLATSDNLVVGGGNTTYTPEKVLETIHSYLSAYSATKVIAEFTNFSRVDKPYPRPKPTPGSLSLTALITGMFLCTYWFMLLDLNKNAWQNIINLFVMVPPTEILPGNSTLPTNTTGTDLPTEDTPVHIQALAISAMVLTILSLFSITFWAAEGLDQKILIKGKAVITDPLKGMWESLKNEPGTALFDFFFKTVPAMVITYAILASMVLTFSASLFTMKGISFGLQVTLLTLSGIGGFIALPPLAYPGVKGIGQKDPSDQQFVKKYITNSVVEVLEADANAHLTEKEQKQAKKKLDKQLSKINGSITDRRPLGYNSTSEYYAWRLLAEEARTKMPAPAAANGHVGKAPDSDTESVFSETEIDGIDGMKKSGSTDSFKMGNS